MSAVNTKGAVIIGVSTVFTWGAVSYRHSCTLDCTYKFLGTYLMESSHLKTEIVNAVWSQHKDYTLIQYLMNCNTIEWSDGFKTFSSFGPIVCRAKTQEQSESPINF